MIDHMTFRVKDIEKTKTFYEKVLGAIGYECTFDQKFGEVRIVGFSRNGKTDTWFTTDEPVSGPTHIAWKVETRAEVDAFYQSALQAGAADNGKPGTREIYHPDYYGAFVLDLDGNNIEAVCHNAD